MSERFVPELLSPAGGLEKLKVAISYGADAVYAGGQKFGLRSAAENFTYDELKEGVEFAHAHGSKVYVVLNSFLHDKDLDDLPEFVKYLDEIKVDAVIASDLGVITTIAAHSDIPIHLSTQASCLNVEAGKLWKEVGVKRLILGREVSIAEAAKIKKATGLEVELFIHGSMCMAYSGNCVISNFTQGRDSNRGGCAHSCRFEYELDFKDSGFDLEKRKAFFMSSKDLEGVRLLPEFIDAEIDSIKVEGRMKSNLYAGTISKVYGEALAYYREHGDLLSEDLINWEKELGKVVHRDYSSGSLVEKAGADSIYDERVHNGAKNDFVVIGNVIESIKDNHLIVQIKNQLNPSDMIELLPFRGDVVEYKVEGLQTISGTRLEHAKPNSLIKLPYIPGVEKRNIIRKRINQ